MGTIVHIISGDLWAGAEVQVFNTLADLHKRPGSIPVSVILFNRGLLRDRLSRLGVECYLVDETENGFLAMSFRVASLFRRLRPDIVHVHHYKEQIVGFLAKLLAGSNTSLIRTVHGRREPPRQGSIGVRWKSKLTLFLETMLTERCHLVAVSSDLGARLAERYQTHRIRVIPNGILLDSGSSTDPSKVRMQLGIPTGALWIASAARLVPVKNLSLLVEAARRLADRAPDAWRIDIYGEGPERSSLEKRIQSLGLEGRVRVMGFIDPIQPVLGGIDVFVLTSFHEGLPMALMEAMAAGAVPVCTRVGGMEEVITDGVDGILIPSGDADALASALARLTSDESLVREMRENARKTATEKFSVTRSNDRLLEYYRMILGPSPEGSRRPD